MELTPRHLHPLLKCIAPGRDVPDIASPWFNHLVTDMKTNSFVCSDPFWAFGGGNPSTGAEVRARLPVIPQAESLTARICSAARKDDPGDTLWDLINMSQRGNEGGGEGAVSIHRMCTHVIIVKTRKQLQALT